MVPGGEFELLLESCEICGNNGLRFGWRDFRIRACWTKLKAERYGASFRWSFLQEDIWVQVGLYLKDQERSLLILSFYPWNTLQVTMQARIYDFSGRKQIGIHTGLEYLFSRGETPTCRCIFDHFFYCGGFDIPLGMLYLVRGGV